MAVHAIYRYIYIYIYVCMYVCMHVICVHTHAHTYIYVHSVKQALSCASGCNTALRGFYYTSGILLHLGDFIMLQDFVTRRGFYYTLAILFRVGDFISRRFRRNIIKRNTPITRQAVYYFYVS